MSNDEKNEDVGAEVEVIFTKDSCSSEGGGVIGFSDQKHRNACKQAERLSRESSPPLLLAFSITDGRALQDSSPSSASSPALPQGEEEEEEEEDSDHTIEEWMMLGGEEQVGDSSIQLNLDCRNSSEDLKVKYLEDTWAVSIKDKSPSRRYFVPDRSMICQICNRTGHLAKRCYYHKKYPTCILCGIRGHIQKVCPRRPCTSCGLLSHGFGPCENPPVWKQHCQRCGMTGHLSDSCPDTWRQYHLTECTKKRMFSGTFPSLPYVCYYDTMEDILQCRTRKRKRAKDIMDVGSLPLSDQLHSSEPTRDSGEESQPRSRAKQEECSRAGRRKTWPEKRRERREIKRLRREAQARREGGLLGKSRSNSDDETCPKNPFKCCPHAMRVSTPPPQKWRRDKADSRKSREAEKWRKRRGIKRGDLHPHSDLDIRSEKFLSPKQRVRHRRR
ncbi:zinc finger CCHC domain-containing protein 7-like isoform X3 [Channa argus]|uniref:zinc finger CCHC domain-containing protein 7-like isoform X3 n=1 Tax=Channa argus TaxID=215402 RepID=UPI0035202DC0